MLDQQNIIMEPMQLNYNYSIMAQCMLDLKCSLTLNNTLQEFIQNILILLWEGMQLNWLAGALKTILTIGFVKIVGLKDLGKMDSLELSLVKLILQYLDLHVILKYNFKININIY